MTKIREYYSWGEGVLALALIPVMTVSAACRTCNWYKAVSVLNRILLNENYIPALINMGNIYFLKEKMKKACAYFERAYEKDLIHPVILLNLSRVNFAMENDGNAKASYRKLISIDQELANVLWL